LSHYTAGAGSHYVKSGRFLTNYPIRHEYRKSRRIITMAKKTGRVATADSYDNFVARVGMQQPNQHAASTYRANYTSRNRLLIEWAYRSSWIIGAAVDSKADDMTKKGVRITSEIDPKRRGILESRFDELQLGIASTRR
jgi:hypothetical protein